MLIPILQAIAGLLILLITFAFADPVSLGGLLGILLLVSAVVRYVMQRNQVQA